MGDTKHHLLLKGTLNVYIHGKGNLCARLKNAIVHSTQRETGRATYGKMPLDYRTVWYNTCMCVSSLYFFRIFGGVVLSCVHKQNFFSHFPQFSLLTTCLLREDGVAYRATHIPHNVLVAACSWYFLIWNLTLALLAYVFPHKSHENRFCIPLFISRFT
jgi:hypothetical protein